MSPEYYPPELVALRQENNLLRDVEKKARAFVATTSYWQQRIASRPEFEALAFALLRADGTPSAAQTLEDPTPHKETEGSLPDAE